MENGLWFFLDITLAGLVVGLGWAAVSNADLRRGVVLFIAFGLLLALVWARLRAPDLALAEAAIGAGLSGALLLAALRDEPHEKPAAAAASRGVVWAVTASSLLLAGSVAWAVVTALSLGDPVRLADQLNVHIGQSGVSNPVTAVLLNFRAYDTLLELAVLLAAVWGVLAIGPARPGYLSAGPVLGALVNWIVPLLIVVAGYLLWVGAHAPGGAFQAGAMLASAAVMLRLGGRPDAGLPGPATQRWLLVSGVGVFLLIGLGLSMSGRAFLQYPLEWSGGLILLIESAATLAIAVTLALAYVGGLPEGWRAAPRSPADTQQESR
jgi:multisubunit Na+/H+ antiporter MnhB subunit